MKKILFLSSAYPYGHFGPSDNCTVRIMEALVQTGQYEVYDISYRPIKKDSKPNYRIVDGVNLLQLPYSEGLKKRSRTYQWIRAFFRIPIYPLERLFSIWKYYKACEKIINDEHFDLVISQFKPYESVMSGALLKKKGFIDKHLLFSWDVIYGRKHNPIIPQRFGLRRQRKVVNWIAQYTDKLVTLYSQKQFHEQAGDVPAAIGKRDYLGIPAISRPNIKQEPKRFIEKGKINFIYAGSIYSERDLEYSIKLLNATSFAERCNLILLFKDPTGESLRKMCEGFKGSIKLSGWVSYEELYSLYSQVDVFYAYSGKWSLGVPGKTYEYLSFGKPILHFYECDDDVNLSVFSPYPLFKGVDVRRSIENNKQEFEEFIEASLKKCVDFEEVERLFPYATMSAYMKVIDDMMEQNV